MPDLSGTRLGRYEVGERLGQGGMATVYRAIQRPLNREVALKVLLPTLTAEPGFATRFENEARTLAGLDHPNILPLYDFDITDSGVAYIAMPLVRGGSLRDLMDRGPLDSLVAWRFLREIGAALAHAHRAGVIHRDLKPANVLLHSDGRTMLADFGLARSSVTPLELTTAGMTIGTPAYMSPEQALGRPLDNRSDIYAMGVLTFEMLTGIQPYRGSTPMEVVVAAVSAPIPSACALNPLLPDELDALLRLVLAKDPAVRPPSVEDFVTELARLPQRRSAGPPVPAPAPPESPAPVAPEPAPASRPATRTGGLLEASGIRRAGISTTIGAGWYFSSHVAAARAVAGERWPEVAASAGLEEFLLEDPPGGDVRNASLERLAGLGPAFERAFGPAAPERLRELGRMAAGNSLRSRPAGTAEQRALRLVPGGERRLRLLLNGFRESLDAVRGEHTHVIHDREPGEIWLVNFDNVFAMGPRHDQPSCHIWIGTLEALLRWGGLANGWVVREVECGSVTGTYDCVFAFRSARA